MESDEFTPDDPASPKESRVRASDAEREAIVQRLLAATGEGRLSLEEFSERSAAVYQTKTRAELDGFLDDLPEPATPARSRLEPVAPTMPIANGATAPATQSQDIGIGSIKRKGLWRIPERLAVEVGLGSIKLDLCEAELAAPQVSIKAEAGIGTIKVWVPEGVRVIVDGDTGIGTRRVDENRLPDNVPAPTIHMNLETGIGTVKVYRVGDGKPRRWRF